MISITYETGGSVTITDTTGAIVHEIAPGKQNQQDAAIAAYVATLPPDSVPPDVSSPITKLAVLLVQKGLLTAKEVSDATAIDIADVAAVVVTG